MEFRVIVNSFRRIIGLWNFLRTCCLRLNNNKYHSVNDICSRRTNFPFTGIKEKFLRFRCKRLVSLSFFSRIGDIVLTDILISKR